MLFYLSVNFDYERKRINHKLSIDHCDPGKCCILIIRDRPIWNVNLAFETVFRYLSTRTLSMEMIVSRTIIRLPPSISATHAVDYESNVFLSVSTAVEGRFGDRFARGYCRTSLGHRVHARRIELCPLVTRCGAITSSFDE